MKKMPTMTTKRIDCMNFSSFFISSVTFINNKSSSHNKRLCNLAQLNGTDNPDGSNGGVSGNILHLNKIISEIFRHNVKKMHIFGKAIERFLENYFFWKNFLKNYFLKEFPPPFFIKKSS